MKKGILEEVIKGADVFIGVSAPGVLTKEMIKLWQKTQLFLPWQTQFLK